MATRRPPGAGGPLAEQDLSAEPGAYEVWYRDEDRILFDWAPKTGTATPRDQKDFVDKEFRPVTDETESSCIDKFWYHLP
jgi:hypothetical protein